ncbi:MAG: amino acid ABC transporter substrate-binding protein [Chloroflexota bacterium]|nr:MAG: amino acid ABC transporter substrate-binding protein [Chloroflexota bacterium]
MKKVMVIFLVVLMLVVLITGYHDQPSRGQQILEAVEPALAAAQVPSSLLDGIQERGVLRVGTECVYKGACYIDPNTNERRGYAVDLTNLMAQDLGVEVEWVDMEWTALIPAIETGKVDIITQGMTLTPERLKVVEMSKPMDWYPGVLLLPADSPLHDLTTLDEVALALNQPDRTITFILGSSQERTTKLMFPNANHNGLDLAAAYLEVATGRADAMFADAGDAFDLTQNNPGAKIWQDEIVYTELGSMVIRAGDQRFLNWLNGWVDFYTANGTLRNTKLASYEERGVPEWMRALPQPGF